MIAFVFFEVLRPNQQLWSCLDGQFTQTTPFPWVSLKNLFNSQYFMYILSLVTMTVENIS